jgi:hypothetical protein
MQSLLSCTASQRIVIDEYDMSSSSSCASSIEFNYDKRTIKPVIHYPTLQDGNEYCYEVQCIDSFIGTQIPYVAPNRDDDDDHNNNINRQRRHYRLLSITQRLRESITVSSSFFERRRTSRDTLDPTFHIQHAEPITLPYVKVDKSRYLSKLQ